MSRLKAGTWLDQLVMSAVELQRRVLELRRTERVRPFGFGCAKLHRAEVLPRLSNRCLGSQKLPNRLSAASCLCLTFDAFEFDLWRKYWDSLTKSRWPQAELSNVSAKLPSASSLNLE